MSESLVTDDTMLDDSVEQEKNVWLASSRQNADPVQPVSDVKEIKVDDLSLRIANDGFKMPE